MRLELCILTIISLSQQIYSLPMTNFGENGNENDVSAKSFVINNEKCETVRYEKIITEPGCKKRVVDSYYCKGQCISGYVPESGITGKFTCSSCKPNITEIVEIELDCGERKRVIPIELYRNCQCMTTQCQVVSEFEINKATFKSSTQSPKQEKPCRQICRKCRKARREFEKLREKKYQTQYLMESCQKADCKERIEKDIFGKVRKQKKVKKHLCKECRICKEKKRKRTNS